MLRHLRKFKGFNPILAIIGGIIVACVTAFLFGLIVMLLWNWIMPDIFGLKTVTYWQSWGLVLLAHILFKTFPGPHRRPDSSHYHADKNVWKAKFRERFWKRPEVEVEEDDDESSDTSTEQGE